MYKIQKKYIIKEFLSIKNGQYSFFFKNNIICHLIKNNIIYLEFYQGNDYNINKNNLILIINIPCQNEVVYIHQEIILSNYLKIKIFNNQAIYYFNIIKIYEKKYLLNLNNDKIDLLNYCNKIKKHLMSDFFIMNKNDKNIIFNKINNIIYKLYGLPNQKIQDIYLNLKSTFLL